MTDHALIECITFLEAEADRMRKQAAAYRRLLAPTRAAQMRMIPPGGSADFRVEDKTAAATIRASAYQTLGRGKTRCERVSKNVVRVHRTA